MIKTLMLSTALVVGATSFVTVGTASAATGKSLHASPKSVMMKRKMKKKPMMAKPKASPPDYGTGPSGGNGKSSATGGNAGGYTNRN